MTESFRRPIFGVGLVLAVVCGACSGGGSAKPGGSGGSGPRDASSDRAGSGMSASGGTPPDGGGGASAGSGVAPTGGAGGAAGGAGGAGGAAGGVGGAAGAGGVPANPCAFTVDHAESSAISTVEIVTWTVGLPNLTEAHIDFGPAGATTPTTAPVNVQDPSGRTLLLGMKANKSCSFRIVATDGATTCTSADFPFTTGALPSNAPTITKPVSGTGGARGFIVTTTGLDLGGISAGQPNAYVFDTDGDVVWWSSTALKENNNGISRAHMTWDATEMWVMETWTGPIESITMDGQTTLAHSELANPDHDFAPLPDGGIATILDPSTTTKTYRFVERHPDGTVVTVVPDLSTLFNPGSFHPNAVHYYQSDDSYTLSDAAGSLFVKFKRNGELIWQLGGSNPLSKSFTLVGIDPWSINHGHHLTADGHFLFFNNNGPAATGGTGQERILDLLLDETSGTATKVWEYENHAASSAFLGDAERLPNGNALVTYSMSGLVQEVDPAGNVVQSWKGTTFGYTDFRTSLYGPPLR